MEAVKVKKDGIKKKYDVSKNKSSYSSKSLPYDKRNISQNSQSQVTKFRKTYKDISPDSQRIVDQIIDPEYQNDVSLVPSYGVGAIYTAHNIIDTKYSAAGDAICLVYPSLRDSIFYTSGESTVQTVTTAGNAINPYLSQYISMKSNTQIIPIVNPFYFSGNHVLLSQPVSGLGFAYGLRPAIAGASTLEIQATIADNHNLSALRFNIQKLDSAFNFLVAASSPFTNGIATITLFSAVLGTEWISMTITNTGGGVVPFDSFVDIQIVQPSAGIPVNTQVNLTNVATHCFIQNINESDTIANSAESYFVSSQSLLLTYEGSTIRDMGRMAISRLPSNSWVGQLGGQSPFPLFQVIINIWQVLPEILITALRNMAGMHFI